MASGAAGVSRAVRLVNVCGTQLRVSLLTSRSRSHPVFDASSAEWHVLQSGDETVELQVHSTRLMLNRLTH